MNTQIFHVFRTYARRPLVLLIAAIAMLIAIGLFANGFVGGGVVSIEPEIRLTDNWAWMETRAWDESLREHRASDLTSVQMIDQPTAAFPDLTPLVNLTTLRLSSHDFTPTKLEKVHSLANLRALAIQAPSVPAKSFSLLGPKLRQLEIPIRLLLSRASEVSQLVELRMLRVDRHGLTPEALSVIAQIPNLKYLVLSSRLTDDYKNPSDPQPAPAFLELTPADLRPLDGHPSLEAIFADWPPQTPRMVPTLPGVPLYPASVLKSWQTGMLLSLFFTAAIAVLVALQVWAQFVVQSAAVIPRYVRPHQLAAIIVLLGGSLVGAVGLWLTEIAILPGLAVALAFPTAVPTLVAASQSRSQIVRAICLPLGFLVAALFWLPMAIAVSLPPVITGEFAWLLRGEFTWIPSVILLSESVLLGYAFVQLPKLTHQVYEKSFLRPGLSPWDPQQQRRTAYCSQKRWLGLPNHEEQYDSLRGDSNWQKARLWRAGNAYRPRNAIMFGGIFVLFFVAMQMLMSGGESFFAPTVWMTCMSQLGLFALLLPAAAWYRRCRNLQVESLRPVSRKAFVRQLFTALAVDQSLALIPFAVVIVYSIRFPRQGGSEAESYSYIAAGLAALVWVYVLSTAMFALKRTWLLVGFIVAMVVLPVVSMMAVGILADEMKVPNNQQLVLVYIHALAILLLALGILWATYRQSLRREWG